MKINENSVLYQGCVFLGGTCANSTWRDELIKQLHDGVPFFNPQVAEWTEADAEREDACKPVARFNVFVITGDALGTYSGWEIHEEASKDASKLIFCTVGELPENQVKGINKIKKGLINMGATVCESLGEIANILNDAYQHERNLPLDEQINSAKASSKTTGNSDREVASLQVSESISSSDETLSEPEI